MDFQANKDLIFQNVAQIVEKENRLKDSVNIIAVTKYVDCETAKKLVDT